MATYTFFVNITSIFFLLNFGKGICECEESRLPPVVSKHWNGPLPPIYKIGIPVTALSLFAVSIVSYRYLVSINTLANKFAGKYGFLELPPAMRFTSRLSQLPLFMCVMSLIHLVIPRLGQVIPFIKISYQALCLYCFLRLMLLYTGGWEALLENYRITDCKPIPLWAPAKSPFILFRPLYLCGLLKPVQPTKFHLKRVHFLVEQFATLGPLIEVLTIVYDNTPCKIMQVITQVTAMYGMSVMMGIVQEDTKMYSIPQKFKLMQVCIILTAFLGVDTNFLSSQK